MNASSFLCIGHRGAMGYRPENTLGSFELAVDMGCPWIELDVYRVGDHLVVIHDDELERTTNGHGRVTARTFDYLRGLDAGDGQQIPTLEEVIDLVDQRAGINVELKGENTAKPVSAMLNAYCQKGWSPEQFLLSSFRHGELARSDPAFPRGALFGKRGRKNYLEAANRLNAWSINLDLSLVGPGVVESAHGEGFKVLVYTVNEPDDIARMLDMGVDGVFTNYPDRVFAQLS